MSAYNEINGGYASENRWLLSDLLRGEWDYDGVVVSDWGAVHDPVEAVGAGTDLRMPGRPRMTVFASPKRSERSNGNPALGQKLNCGGAQPGTSLRRVPRP